MNVEAVSKHQHVALFEIRLNILLVHIRLQLIVDQNHNDIRPLRCLGIGLNRNALLLSLLSRLGALVKTDANFNSGILQVQCMRMSLAAVADDCHSVAL